MPHPLRDLSITALLLLQFVISDHVTVDTCLKVLLAACVLMDVFLAQGWEMKNKSKDYEEAMIFVI